MALTGVNELPTVNAGKDHNGLSRRMWGPRCPSLVSGDPPSSVSLSLVGCVCPSARLGPSCPALALGWGPPAYPSCVMSLLGVRPPDPARRGPCVFVAIPACVFCSGSGCRHRLLL